MIDGDVSNVSFADCDIKITPSENRKFAKYFDIAPNGKLDVQNDFEGTYYIGEKSKIKGL